MKHITYNIITIIVFFVTCFVLRVTWVNAQLKLNITVYPAIFEQTVSPGETTRMLVQFRNNDKDLVHGTIKVADYIIADKTGTPMLVENLPAGRQGSNQVMKYGASKWITPSYDNVSIPANDFVAVVLNITVPNNVINCGNYAIVYFEPDAGTTLNEDMTVKSESAISAKVGALVNFKVKNIGCIEDVRVMSLNIPTFLEYGPISTSYDLFNFGNVHVNPKGSLTITDLLNNVSDKQAIKEQNIFPETAKNYQTNIGTKWMFGRYKITLNTNYGEKNLPLLATGYVWVFPWRIALIILLTIVLLIIIIRATFNKVSQKEKILEKELLAEKTEIEKLKESIKKKSE